MEPIAEVLHELVGAARHVLTPNRIGELHGLVDEGLGVAKDAGEVAAAVKDAEQAVKTGPKAPADGAAGA